MAGLKKLKASSILEVTVALVLLMLIFTIAMLTFVRLTAGSTVIRKVQAEQLLVSLAQHTVKEQQYYDESIEDTGWKLVRKVTQVNESLVLLECMAIDDAGKEWANVKKLIYVPEKKE